MPEESIVFQRLEEKPLSKGNLVKTIPTLFPEYEITFEIHPTAKLTQDSESVIHFTSTGNDCCNSGDCCPGDRIPGIWFNTIDNTVVNIQISISNAISNSYSKSTNDAVPLNQWTEIKIKQSFQSDLTYLYELSMNGQVYHCETNTSPQEWSNVKVYAADPWYDAATASIRNFKIKTESNGKKF